MTQKKNESDIRRSFANENFEILSLKKGGNNHLKIMFQDVNGNTGLVYASSTPSTRNIYKRLISEARRSLREHKGV